MPSNSVRATCWVDPCRSTLSDQTLPAWGPRSRSSGGRAGSANHLDAHRLATSHVHELAKGCPEPFGRFGSLPRRIGLEQLGHRKGLAESPHVGTRPEDRGRFPRQSPHLRPAECCSHARVVRCQRGRAELPRRRLTADRRRVLLDQARSPRGVSPALGFLGRSRHDVPNKPPWVPRSVGAANSRSDTSPQVGCWASWDGASASCHVSSARWRLSRGALRGDHLIATGPLGCEKAGVGPAEQCLLRGCSGIDDGASGAYGGT